MFYTRKKRNISIDGPRHLAHNKSRPKLGFNLLYVQLKFQKISNETVPVHRIHNYNELKIIVTYSIQSDEEIQLCLQNTGIL